MIALFLAVAASFVTTVVTTPILIRWLRARGIGQQIRDDGPIPHPHIAKVGTPSMGGITIIGGTVVGYFAAHLHRTESIKYARSGMLLLVAIVGMGAIPQDGTSSGGSILKAYRPHFLNTQASCR